LKSFDTALALSMRATFQLAPEAFTELPRSLQTELRRRGCSIPQPFTNDRRQNVIRGYNRHQRYEHQPARMPIAGGTINVAVWKRFIPEADQPLWIAVHV
jgi:hypothetical protein